MQVLNVGLGDSPPLLLNVGCCTHSTCAIITGALSIVPTPVLRAQDEVIATLEIAIRKAKRKATDKFYFPFRCTWRRVCKMTTPQLQGDIITTLKKVIKMKRHTVWIGKHARDVALGTSPVKMMTIEIRKETA